MHIYVLAGILLVVVILFGISSTAQSYATAQQAKAQIETAQAAQISAWGNLVTLLTIALLIFLVIALLGAVLWLMAKRSAAGHQRSESVRAAARPAQLSVRDLIDLQMLRMLERMNGGAVETHGALDAPKEEEDLPSWLHS